MYSGVDYVREICQQRKIAVSTLEKECGFANGYLNPKKLKKIPYDRAVKIAKYLNISVDVLLPDLELEKTPTIAKEDLQAAFWGGEKDLTQEDMDAMWADVENFAAFVAQKRRQEKKND